MEPPPCLAVCWNPLPAWQCPGTPSLPGNLFWLGGGIVGEEKVVSDGGRCVNGKITWMMYYLSCPPTCRYWRILHRLSFNSQCYVFSTIRWMLAVSSKLCLIYKLRCVGDNRDHFEKSKVSWSWPSELELPSQEFYYHILEGNPWEKQAWVDLITGNFTRGSDMVTGNLTRGSDMVTPRILRFLGPNTISIVHKYFRNSKRMCLCANNICCVFQNNMSN